MLGTRVADRYEITGELGRGGMGVVYRARDPILNREIALKIVAPSLLNPQTEERFQREAQLVAQMDHPSIVPVYDFGRHDGSLFFLMPLVRGTNLRSFLRERTHSLGEVIDIVSQIADGLDYSHARGVVHRDIKPENVMIEEVDGAIRVRVMDFGLAKAAASDNRLTKTGTLVGTISYFSPEQVYARDVDGRSDLYSLGVILYECLAGDPPFVGEMQTVLYRIVHENARPLRSVGVDIAEELDAIVMRTLAKDPARRYQRAGELADALRAHRAKLQDSDREKAVLLSTAMTAQFQRIPTIPFVGRDKETAELQRRLNHAIDGESQFVVVGGEPGVGKTRLVEELENLAKARKIRVLHGRFVEQDRTFSYQGFVEIIQEYFRYRDTGHSSAEHPDLSDLGPELVSHFPLLGEISELRGTSDSHVAAAAEPRKADDRTYLYELLARTIARIGAGKPLVLVFENLHGAEMSLDALGYIVRRLGPTPTLVIGTYRQTEIDRRHPLTKLLDGFSDDPRYSSIILGPLSRSEHRKLIEVLVGGHQLAHGVAETLFDATEANPFFTKELVRSLVDSGGIAPSETGEWALSGALAIASESLPATIQQTVEKRIERLPEAARELLSHASVIGKSFDFRDLELLLESRRDAEDLVDALITDGILEEARDSRGDQLTFSSGIVRDVLYGALSRRRRKSLHRRYAEQLERRHQGRLERVYPQLLHHFSEGDVPEKSVEYGMLLAARSIEAFSPDEAVRVLKVVLDFLEDEEWEGDRATRAEAHLMVASAQRMLGNLDVAAREAESAAKAFDAAGRREGAARALLLAAEITWQARRVDETRQWLSQGIEVARKDTDVVVLASLLSLAATVANLRGEYARAKEYLDEAARLTQGAAPDAHETVVASGGHIVAAVANSVAATEPAEVNIVEEGEVLGLIFDNLVMTDEQGHLVPHLAEEWEVRDAGMSLMFRLRRGVRFHDGTELTTHHVKRSFERTIRKRGRNIPGAFNVIEGVAAFIEGSADDVRGLEVLGDRELLIRIVEPFPIYPALLSDPTTGVARVADDGRVVGTGAFRVKTHEPHQIVLERNPDSWRSAPARLDSIEFRLLPGSSAIASALRSGAVDLGRDLLPEDIDDFTRDPRFKAGFVEAPKKTTYFAVFNVESAVGGNELARQALCRVLRVQDLVWSSIGRLAQPAVCLIPPSVPAHDPGRKRTVVGQEQAREMLQASGLALPVTIRAAVHPLLLDRYHQLMDSLLASWRAIGVEVEIVASTIETYLAAFRNNRTLDILIGRYNADYDDPDNFTSGLFRTGSGIMSAYFSSPASDELFDEARSEQQPARREALYRQFETEMINSGTILPLFHEIDYRIANAEVAGLRLRSTRPYVNYVEIGRQSGAPRSPVNARGEGGSISIPIPQPIYTFDPPMVTTAEENTVACAIFETLTRCGEGAQVLPWLARDYRAEDGGRRYRFWLRDARFHDGRRLTARDVRFSWERGLMMRDGLLQTIIPMVRGASRLIGGESHDLEGFRIIASDEFVVDLEQPLAFFPALLSAGCTAIVPEGTDRLHGDWRTGCAGTGPFRIVQFDPGRRMELERNPDYWRPGLPKSDALVFRLAMSAEQIRDEFRNGALSLATELNPADFEAMRHDPLFAAGYREVPRLSIYYAAFNTREGPLSDVGLRRSLLEGIDPAPVVAKTLGRLAIPASGVIPPGLLGYSPTAARVSGIVHQRDGETIELDTTVHPLFFGQYETFGKEMRSLFAARGVKLKFGREDFSDFLRRQTGGHADVCIGRWVADYPDADTFVDGMLHSQRGALGRYVNSPEIDRLSDRARTEFDPTARHAIYRKVHEIIARDALLLPLFHEQIYRFARPEVEGLRLNLAIPEVALEELRVRH